MSKNDPRKDPKQKRAQETRRAIIEASRELLAKHGFDSFTTAKVAERAGVSVGSLYQYYPNKESLVAAVLEDEVRVQIEIHERIIAEGAGKDLEDIFSELLDANHAHIAKNTDLHKVLAEAIHKMGRAHEVIKGELDAVRSTRELLEHFCPDDRDLEKTAYILLYSNVNIVRACLSNRPEYLSDPDFMAHLKDLIIGFIRKRVLDK